MFTKILVLIPDPKPFHRLRSRRLLGSRSSMLGGSSTSERGPSPALCCVSLHLSLHGPRNPLQVSLCSGTLCPWALPGLTLCNWHSALRLSWTTALQQLPDADHGGRMKSQMKGSEPIFNFSAILKKREAFRPFTSAQASSDTDTAGETAQTRDVSGAWKEQRSPVF